MSSVPAFCSTDDSAINASVPSVDSGFSGAASVSEGVCVTGTGLTGNTDSVSECGLSLDGEPALDDSAACRFSAENKSSKVMEVNSMKDKTAISLLLVIAEKVLDISVLSVNDRQSKLCLLMFVAVYPALCKNWLTLLQSRSQQRCGLRQVF